jgi:cytochrome c-type biogenesis protein CcmE
MKKNGYYVLGVLLLLAFAGFSLSSFKQTLTPYVSYQEARSAERLVQVAGALEKGSSQYRTTEQALYFTIREPQTRQQLRVRYHGVKPGNFEDAISVVAIGHYDHGSNEFAADKLLVKCPSKYQGAEVKAYS